MKTYRIDTFKKLLNAVNSENSERMAIDLANWLVLYADWIEQYRKAFPGETEGKANTQIANCVFQWIDDGKSDILGYDIVNEQTGEVVHHSFEEPKENTEP